MLIQTMKRSHRRRACSIKWDWRKQLKCGTGDLYMLKDDTGVDGLGLNGWNHTLRWFGHGDHESNFTKSSVSNTDETGVSGRPLVSWENMIEDTRKKLGMHPSSGVCKAGISVCSCHGPCLEGTRCKCYIYRKNCITVYAEVVKLKSLLFKFKNLKFGTSKSCYWTRNLEGEIGQGGQTDDL